MRVRNNNNINSDGDGGDDTSFLAEEVSIRVPSSSSPLPPQHPPNDYGSDTGSAAGSDTAGSAAGAPTCYRIPASERLVDAYTQAAVQMF